MSRRETHESLVPILVAQLARDNAAVLLAGRRAARAQAQLRAATARRASTAWRLDVATRPEADARRAAAGDRAV